MTRREIARIAFAEGMTAKEAGLKYGFSAESIRKVICRFKLPNLVTEYERIVINQVARLNDTQLKSYHTALLLPKNKKVSKIEKNVVAEELKKRKLS
ncbi:hypothetical protein UFOVP460_26 [uncultured Caudovirales phage]|uniref:Uncharacterized protein n=1 Tax=uncultured Caudovirales phage TaxID=2100421 RepID=A0A6J5MG09_9CAUD|nr:hypothetical protein UFOVP460_26 [uncultured Caudovirales phage]